jgi:hypothetical protein
LASLGDVLFSVSAGFFQRGISAMMTFFRLGFGGSKFVLASSLVIVFLLTFYEKVSWPRQLNQGDGTKSYCAGGDGSWRIKLSNYLLRPNLAGYASLGGERAGSLSSRNIGISSHRDLRHQLSIEHILAFLRQVVVAFAAIIPWALF